MGVFGRRKAKDASPQDPEQLVHRKEVVIPFGHLSSGMRKELRDPLDLPAMSIRSARVLRGVSEVGAAVNVEVLRRALSDADGSLFGLGAVGLSATIFGRAVKAKRIQQAHTEAIEAMNRFGLLDTKFEGSYPKDWTNPATVARFHPIFFVDGRGNLHLLRPNKRGEAFRHRWQQTRLGKLGLIGWRWRAYLKPPTFPAREASWAKRAVRALRSRPAASAPLPLLGGAAFSRGLGSRGRGPRLRARRLAAP